MLLVLIFLLHFRVECLSWGMWAIFLKHPSVSFRKNQSLSLNTQQFCYNLGYSVSRSLLVENRLYCLLPVLWIHFDAWKTLQDIQKTVCCVRPLTNAWHQYLWFLARWGANRIIDDVVSFIVLMVSSALFMVKEGIKY